jgi:L-iditol 2-dehydrogenase
MPFSTAALVEPISVALGGIQRANVVFGQPVLICGAGPIGLNALAIARAAGAYPILVTDIAQHKLDRAREMGADLAVCCEAGWDGKEIGRRVRDAFEMVEVGLQPEVALECTGAQASFYGAGYGELRRNQSHRLAESSKCLR